MKNKKKTVTIIAIIGIGLAIIGGIGFYTCYHTWNAATCTRPIVNMKGHGRKSYIFDKKYCLAR